VVSLTSSSRNRPTGLVDVLQIIRRTDRRGLVRTVVASVIGAIMDVSALAVLVPFLTVVTKPTLIDTHWLLVPIRKSLGINSVVAALIGLSCVTIVGLFVLAAGRIWARHRIVRFIHGQRDMLCLLILRGQFYTSYWGDKERSTRELLESVFGDVDVFIDKAVRPTIELFANLLVCVVFVIALLYVDLFATMLVVVCGLLYFALLSRITRSGIDSGAHLRAVANANRFRYALNILDGRRDIRIYGVDRPFFAAFEAASSEFADSVSANTTLVQLSSYLTHAIAFSAIVAGVTVAIVTNADPSLAVPMIGTYVFAGARLVPALAGAFSAWSELRYSRPAVDALQSTLDYVDATLSNPSNESRNDRILLMDRILLSSVRFGYPRGHTIRCCDEMSIKAGDIIGITGESGSGKSAFLLSLMGLLPLKAGLIEIDGTPIGIENRRAWLNNISYLGQTPFFLDDSVASNIAFGIPPEKQDRVRIIDAAKAAGAHEFIIHDIPAGYDGVIGEGGLRISGGQRQRLAIARGLYAGRQVLLLDEMTSALDAASERKVIDTLLGLGEAHTILIVTHRREPLEICDVIFRIQNGELRRYANKDDIRIGGGSLV
jgi:ATP-binding cassette, subfamily B, bacterial PglK